MDKEAYAEWSRCRDAMLEEMRRTLDSLTKIAEVRSTFFDKLVLLATGSFALSLTFLGSLHKHAAQGLPFVAVGYLKAAWVLMLLCIVTGWFHNLYQGNSLQRLTNGVSQGLLSSRMAVTQGFMERTSRTMEEPEHKDFFSKTAAQLAQLTAEGVKESQNLNIKALEISSFAARIGSVAVLSIVAAFVLLLIFAFKNIWLL